MIKCACGEKSCVTGVHFESAPLSLWFTDKDDRDTLMYLSVDTIQELIVDLTMLLVGYAKACEFDASNTLSAPSSQSAASLLVDT